MLDHEATAPAGPAGRPGAAAARAVRPALRLATVPRAAAAPGAVLLVALAVLAVLSARLAPPGTFALGAAVPVACGVALLVARRTVGDRSAAHVPALTVVATLFVVRGGGWALYALDAGDGVVALPAAGDLVAPVAGVAAVVAAAARAPLRTPARRRLLVLDTAVAASAVVLALWLVAIGPRVGFDPGRPQASWLLVLVGVLVVEQVAGALVLSRGAVSRSSPTVVALLLVSVADVAVLLDGTDAERAVPAWCLLSWSAGWLLLTWRVLTVRAGDRPDQSDEAVTRREIVSTDLATAVSAGAFAVVVLVVAADGGRVLAGPLNAVLCCVVMVAWVSREVLLGGERGRLLDELREQATHDALTGLVNRRGLTARIAGVPPTATWTIVALDLDGFKAVNDVHGHERGDDVLVTAAHVLRDCTPPGGVAARTGGDEFALLVPGDVPHARAVADVVVRRVAQTLAGLALIPSVTVSAGVGRLREERTASAAPDRLTALAEAAAALDAAKLGGRARVCLYAGAVATARERRLLVERRLREAVREQRVVTRVQPVVDLATGRLVGGEALARWHDDELGDVPPGEFVPVAEQTGLVTELGAQVLRHAVAGARDSGAPGRGVRVAVNVSPIQLRDSGFAALVEDVLAEAGVAPSALVVEVTEAVLVEDGDPALGTLETLRSLGVTLAIDDFGTGYAALGYLRGLPVSLLKIDRSLLVAAAAAERTRRIVAGVTDLAHRIGVEVAVEGIEDPAAARMCRLLGADYGQGWLYGGAETWEAFGRRVDGPVL